MIKKIFDSENFNDEGEFLQDLYDEELYIFKNFLNSIKTKFEKRYKTTIEEVILCGKVGLWNGSPIGGKVTSLENIFNVNCDSFDVNVEDDKSIQINFHHHDGTHCMNIYFLTRNSFRKLNLLSEYDNYGLAYLKNNYKFFEEIYNKLTPIKFQKNNYYSI